MLQSKFWKLFKYHPLFAKLESLLNRKSHIFNQNHIFYCLGLGLRIGKSSNTFLNITQIVNIIKEKFNSNMNKIYLKFSFLQPDIKLSKSLSKEFKSDLKVNFSNKKCSELEKIIMFSYKSYKNSQIKQEVLLKECIR